MKKRILTLIVALLLALSVPAFAVPNPNNDFYVLDEADVLSNATAERIIYNNDLLYEACGAQIVFVTVDSTDGEAIDDYANDLFNEWGIGSAKKNNGFLVLMAIDDDNYYALPGSGLEKELSSGEIKLLLDDYLEPDFAKKEYSAGARKLFNQLFNTISEIYDAGLKSVTPPENYSLTEAAGARKLESAPARSSGSSAGLFGGIFSAIGSLIRTVLIIIVVIVIIIVLSVGRSRSRRRSRPIVPHAPNRRNTTRPIIIHTPSRPRPGHAPRPSRPSTPRSGGGGRSSFGGASRSGSRSSFGGGRSGGGGASRGGGAGRGR